MKSLTQAQLADIFARAHAAGMAAGQGAKVQAMTVGSPTTPFGNTIDYSKETYHVPDGPCGFAWVTIRPANCTAAKYAKTTLGARAGYYGGIEISCRYFNQSMARKEAYCYAFAEVLTAAGIKASVGSRMD